MHDDQRPRGGGEPQMETHGIVLLVTTVLTLLAWRVW